MDFLAEGIRVTCPECLVKQSSMLTGLAECSSQQPIELRLGYDAVNSFCSRFLGAGQETCPLRHLEVLKVAHFFDCEAQTQTWMAAFAKFLIPCQAMHSGLQNKRGQKNDPVLRYLQRPDYVSNEAHELALDCLLQQADSFIAATLQAHPVRASGADRNDTLVSLLQCLPLALDPWIFSSFMECSGPRAKLVVPMSSPSIDDPVVLMRLVLAAPKLRNLTDLTLTSWSTSAVVLELLPALTSLSWLQSLHFIPNSMAGIAIGLFGARLAEMSALESLVMPSLQLPFYEVVPFANSLMQLTALTSLDLREMLCLQYSAATDSAHLLASSIRELKQLRHLCLGNNCIASDAMSFLGTAISTLPNLEQLDLSHNQLGYPGGCEALLCLSKLSSLSALDLGSNELGMMSFPALGRLLSTLTGLKSLALSENIAYYEGAAALRDSLPFLSQLTALSLSNCCLSGGAMSTVGKGLRAVVTLKQLRMSGNLDEDHDFDHHPLFFLEQLAGLEFLDFSDNYLDPAGSRHLMEIVSHLSELTCLDLKRNDLCLEEICAWTAVVQGFTKLTCLQLDECTAGNGSSGELCSEAEGVWYGNGEEGSIEGDNGWHEADVECSLSWTLGGEEYNWDAGEPRVDAWQADEGDVWHAEQDSDGYEWHSEGDAEYGGPDGWDAGEDSAWPGPF